MLRSRIVSLGVSLPGRRLFRDSSLDHAVRAGRDALAHTTYWPADIELLINAGVHRDKHYAEPAFACFIQRELGLNIDFQGRQTFSYDLIDGAMGVLNALDTLDAHIRTGRVEVGMAVASEVNTDRHPRPEYRTARSGAAIILDASPEAAVGFRSFRFRTFPEHAGLYESYVDLSVKRGCLHIDRSPDFEGTALAAIGETVPEFLRDEGLSPGDIDLVLPSQVSRSFVAELGKHTGVPQDRVIDLTGDFPDTHSTAPLLALDKAMKAGLTGKGKRALFVGIGAGLNVGAAIYEF
jgi:3-oxoacyl-[acyl-carrier-protein] synthase III